MFFNRNLNQSEPITNLHTVAETYSKMGFSVIPTYANKRPAVKWGEYQRRLATIRDLQDWFLDFRNPGIAIICGTLSRLIALDFDNEAQFTRFQSEHPELNNTLTINSRRGNHLWYLIPEHTHVASRHTDGIDLLAEGCYVIAPPSTINGHTYTFANQLPIMELTTEQIDSLSLFVGGEIVEPEPQPRDAAQPLSASELRGYYRKHAYVGNRNQTLFQAAIAARDAGWARAAVMELLVKEHIATGVDGEKFHQREREAVRTIQSAFSRSTRTVIAPETFTLPNGIKEALFSQGLTCVVRLLEALWQLGYRPGEIVHPQDLKQELQGIVGWHSIHKALKATVGTGLSLFEPIHEDEMVSPRTPSSEASAIPTSTDADKMLLSVRKNRKKLSNAGRKKVFYRVPDFTELFQKLDVEPSRTCDALPEAAVCSAKETRKAMGEALIRRRPGRYGRKKLAQRLGISVRTLDTYHKEFAATYADFNKEHRFIEKPIYWKNLDEIPDHALLHNGVFLIDETGKRYPATKSVAIMLLKQGKWVTLMQQTFNEYWFGLPFQYPSRVKQLQQSPINAEKQPEQWRESANAYWTALRDAPETHNAPNLPNFGDFQKRVEDSRDTFRGTRKPNKVSKPKERPHDPKRPFPYMEDEELVTRLQKRINQLCKQPGQRISKRTLREFIITYGKSAVRQAIKVVEKRDNIENPVGFIRVKLRSDSKRHELEALMRSLGQSRKSG